MTETDNILLLVNELIKQPVETEWLEFKVNNDDPETIARDISALANAATYRDVSTAYFVWGVTDDTHEIVGTSFDYRKSKKGNEELENWLHHQLSRNASFSFEQTSAGDRNIVVLKIQPAIFNTVDFESTAYIRVGSYTKKLKDYPAIESAVWNRITKSNYEAIAAKDNLLASEALQLLDYPKYFSLLGIAMPQTPDDIVHYLCEDKIVSKQDDGRYAVTNLGALLLAHSLSSFPSVARKALRIVQYEGPMRLEISRQRTSTKGYACDFEAAIEFIMALIPSREPVGQALREKITAYPELAIRETLANALIHQDLALSGNGPLVEIFDNRIEFTNPGAPLVDILRLVDNPPRSRNQQLASLMRRFNMCEELGTGWDKIINSCETSFLPAPKVSVFRENGDSMRVALLAYTPFNRMNAEDRKMACYWHACICQTSGQALNNPSLRSRFGLEAPSTSTISRLIRDTVADGLIKPVDPNTAPRYMSYVPWWA